jgi:pantetheine-phosphate adenylyltransferase
MSILTSDIESLIEYENKIFKEYQFADYDTEYKPKRLSFLTQLYLIESTSIFIKYPNIKQLINYVTYRNIKIGLFPGSFDMFTVGHLDILNKAEKIFDKVIIARGKNSDKKEWIYDLPESIKNRQIIEFDTTILDLVNKLNNNVTIIRGLRNEEDFQHEKNYTSYINDFNPDIKIINIICDSKYGHVSSSSVKKLLIHNIGHNYIIK